MPSTPLIALSTLLSPSFVALVLNQRQAIIASIVLVLVIIVAWKFLKLAFKIALIVVVAVLIFWALKAASIL